jgi:hypothetical protein
VEKTFRKLFAEYSAETSDPFLEKAPAVDEKIDENNPWLDWGATSKCTANNYNK